MNSKNETDEALERISKAVESINKSTAQIKKIDKKLNNQWNPITFVADPYKGSGKYKGD